MSKALRFNKLESVCLFFGLLLLVVFFSTRAGQEQARSDGIAAFQTQLAGQEAETTNVNSLFAGIAMSESPDQSLWSENRISQYEISRSQPVESPLAILRIRNLDIEVPVYNGTDELVLDRGAGRIPGTAKIGEPGNLALAGHRDGFFRGLKDIREGDEIDLLTAQGTVVYTVDSIKIVDPSDVSVLSPTEQQSITLVTCYPFYFVGHAPSRYIVKASFKNVLAMR